jgi:hypothetical protein
MKKLGLRNDEPLNHSMIEEEDDGLGGNLTLLNTIKLPKNLKLLSDRLPKSKYEEDRFNKDKGSKASLHEVTSTKSFKS